MVGTSKTHNNMEKDRACFMVSSPFLPDTICGRADLVDCEDAFP